VKEVEVLAFKRTDIGTKFAKNLRAEGMAPGVLYGGEQPVHFYAPMIMFKDLLYSPNMYKVNLNVEGTVYACLLQDVTFHPVSEVILHVDFLLMRAGVPVKAEVPIVFEGTSPGVQLGGKFMQKIRRIKVKALPENLPSEVVINISKLELGKNVRVSDIKKGEFEILANPQISVAAVTIPRALKSQQAEEAKKK